MSQIFAHGHTWYGINEVYPAPLAKPPVVEQPRREATAAGDRAGHSGTGTIPEFGAETQAN
jgi:hypothetical protein